MGSIHGGEEFLHSIIREDSRHEGSFQDDAPEDDGSQYLNDTGDGNAEQPEIEEEKIGTEVHMQFVHI